MIIPLHRINDDDLIRIANEFDHDAEHISCLFNLMLDEICRRGIAIPAIFGGTCSRCHRQLSDIKETLTKMEDALVRDDDLELCKQISELTLVIGGRICRVKRAGEE